MHMDIYSVLAICCKLVSEREGVRERENSIISLVPHSIPEGRGNSWKYEL